jgi:hypothetical protein
MCTVTYRLARPDNEAGIGLEVTMNRDELRARTPEIAPAVSEPPAPGGLPWLGPRDGQRGGAWFAVGGAGVVGCLLNHYPPGQAPESVYGRDDLLSRGGILPRALSKPSFEQAVDVVRHDLDLGRYAAFSLLLLSRSEAYTCAWDGHGLWESAAGIARRGILSSSSWRTAAVLAWRMRRYEEWLIAGASESRGLPAFHLLQPEGLAEYAPLLDRREACTRSITQVRIYPKRAQAEMRYWPRLPGGGLDPAPQRDTLVLTR